jgi:cobalt-precorrin-5B (C1)-methyltransferase
MKNLRGGYSTGTCAACAAKAAVRILLGQPAGFDGDVRLPDGQIVRLPLAWREQGRNWTRVAVRKNAGDDPDATHGLLVEVEARFAAEHSIEIVAGEGVGTVTRPGLAIAPGKPAINPVPLRMIRSAVRELTSRGLRLRVSIPGGDQVAKNTFNPRLGIVGGLSVLGTTGRVRPFSLDALQESIRCGLKVATASGVNALVLVPGEIGRRAALGQLNIREEQVVQAVNEWGMVIDELIKTSFHDVLVLGHPGKLAKLADGHFNTHSKKSPSALPMIKRLALSLWGRMAGASDSLTVEGFLMGLEKHHQRTLSNLVATAISKSVTEKSRGVLNPSVVLINLAGAILGSYGSLKPWR